MLQRDWIALLLILSGADWALFAKVLTVAEREYPGVAEIVAAEIPGIPLAGEGSH